MSTYWETGGNYEVTDDYGWTFVLAEDAQTPMGPIKWGTASPNDMVLTINGEPVADGANPEFVLTRTVSMADGTTHTLAAGDVIRCHRASGTSTIYFRVPMYNSSVSLAAISQLLEPLPPLGSGNVTVQTPSYTRQHINNFFNGSSLLRVLQPYVFKNLIVDAYSGYNYVFSSTIQLRHLPEHLLDGFPATNYSYWFYSSGLMDLPADLFTYATGITSFDNCFNTCSYLESIPSRLFRGTNVASSCSFTYCFNGCSRLTSLPAKLFDSIDNPRFSNTFSGCSSLTTLSAGLFDNCYLTTLSSLFSNLPITHLPAIFKDCTFSSDASFENMFNGCTALETIDSTFFDDLPKGANLLNMFAGCTSLRHIPEVWNMGFIGNHQRMFYQCSAADNYNDVPSGWK